MADEIISNAAARIGMRLLIFLGFSYFLLIAINLCGGIDLCVVGEMTRFSVKQSQALCRALEVETPSITGLNRIRMAIS
jgi:hypothetical protein